MSSHSMETENVTITILVLLTKKNVYQKNAVHLNILIQKQQF